MRLSPVPRFLMRWLIRGILMFVFLGLPTAVFYLREVGFGPEIKHRIEAEISRGPVKVSIGRLIIDPFHGLVAGDVEVSDAVQGGRALASVKQLVLSLNLAELLARRVVIDSISLDGTNVSMPLEQLEGDPKVHLRNVDASLTLLADQARLTRFEGDLEGIHVSLSGLLKNPLAARMPSQPKSEEHAEQRQRSMFNVVTLLRELRFPGNKPQLRAELSGDLADIKTVVVSNITLDCGPVVAPRWNLESVEMEAEYNGGRLTIQRLNLRGKSGSASGWAQWGDGITSFELTSTLSPEAFRPLFPKKSMLEEMQFAGNPRVELQGTISPVREDTRITGSLRSGAVEYRNVSFQGLAADFIWLPDRYFARDIRIGTKSGELHADVMSRPGDFRLKLAGDISPSDILDIFQGGTKDMIARMQFRDTPHVEIELSGESSKLDDLSGTGFVKLGRTALNNVWVDSGHAQLAIADRAVTYRNLEVLRGKLMGSGTLTYDFANQLIRLQGITSTLPPVDVLTWADPKMAEVLKPYRFHEPPRVSGDGVIYMKNPKENDLALKMSAPAGMDYDLLGKTLDFDSLSGNVDIVGTEVKVDIRKAAIFDGNLALKATISSDPKNPVYGADISASGMNFADVTKLYFNYDDSQGEMNGRFRFTARSGQEKQMRGEGSIRVQDGHVFAIPLLGPLSDILDKIIDGVGYQAAKLASADFTMGDQKINTKNLEIQGNGFSLYGYGDIFFVTDKMDMSVRINAHGIPGLVLFPVSKLFEYVSTGTVSKPEWRPKIIPRLGNGGGR